MQNALFIGYIYQEPGNKTNMQTTSFQ